MVLIYQVGIVAINVIGDPVRKPTDATDPVSYYAFSLHVVCHMPLSLSICLCLSLSLPPSLPLCFPLSAHPHLSLSAGVSMFPLLSHLLR